MAKKVIEGAPKTQEKSDGLSDKLEAGMLFLIRLIVLFSVLIPFLPGSESYPMKLLRKRINLKYL